MEGGWWLGEEGDRGMAEDGAGNGQALALPAGEVLALLAHMGIIAIRQARDHLMDRGFFRRFYDVFDARSRPPKGNILANGALKEQRVLQHHTHVVAQHIQRVQADGHTIDYDCPLLPIVEARAQADERGFPAALEAAQANLLARTDM